MKLFFNSKTCKLFDITTHVPTELDYRYKISSTLSTTSNSSDKFAETAYRVSEKQIDIGKVPNDIFFPEVLEDIFFEIPCKDDFLLGYNRGQIDGYVNNQRIYMSKIRHVSWSFIVGYEYGVLIGSYLRNKKMAD